MRKIFDAFRTMLIHTSESAHADQTDAADAVAIDG
jgi:hypothetical protein